MGSRICRLTSMSGVAPAVLSLVKVVVSCEARAFDAVVLLGTVQPVGFVGLAQTMQEVANCCWR